MGALGTVSSVSAWDFLAKERKRKQSGFLLGPRSHGAKLEALSFTPTLRDFQVASADQPQPQGEAGKENRPPEPTLLTGTR